MFIKVEIKAKNSIGYFSTIFSDHTLGTSEGYYMYIETSYPRQPGDKARLISPAYDSVTGGSCLEFFYHMWGPSTGALNVFLKANNFVQGAPLWALSGDQDDLWRVARGSILSSGKYQVIADLRACP